MPIIDLQVRMRQLGEIRLGHVVATANGKTRPAKLDKFRFTSPSEAILNGVAHAFGGEVKPWTPANGGPAEFEVYTETNRLPVIIPPMAVTQWRELYKGSTCVRRCDGVTEQKSDRPCMCNPEARDCAITTRLNVMLRDVSPIGMWLLTSHGYYAAVELPPIAELLARGQGNVPGWLAVEERRIVREKPGGGTETIRFMVPTLDIDLSPSQILSGSGGLGAPQLESVNRATGEISATHTSSIPPHLAIDPPPSCDEFIARAMESKNADQVRDIWRDAAAAGCIDAPLRIGERETTLSEMLRVLGEGFMKASEAKPAAPVDESAPDASPVAAWTALLASWAGDTQSALDAFGRASGGREPADCTAREIGQFAAMMAVPVEAEPVAPDMGPVPF